MTVPEEAVTAAAEAMNEELGYEYPPGDRRLEELIETALEAAAPIIRTDERERIAKLAEDYGASYDIAEPCGCGRLSCAASVRSPQSFADLVREQP